MARGRVSRSSSIPACGRSIAASWSRPIRSVSTCGISRSALDSRSPLIIASIEIEGVALDDAEIEAFAVADGFGGALADGFARRRMGAFWIERTCLGDLRRRG